MEDPLPQPNRLLSPQKDAVVPPLEPGGTVTSSEMSSAKCPIEMWHLRTNCRRNFGVSCLSCRGGSENMAPATKNVLDALSAASRLR